ncbi:hypothetical protein Tco_0610507 [Tanacetum coccineum]
MHSRDERRTTQNSGICSLGEDKEMYYGQLEQILEFSYMSFKTVLFRVKWFNTRNKGVIVVEDNPDIIHVDNSSDLALTTTLNDLEIPALHINGQSIDVDAPPDIIDVDEDDDIINDEDVLPHDLADSDDEDLVNVDDDDGVAVMSTDVARGHGGDGGGDDRPPPNESARGCRGKGTRKPNLGGRKIGIMHTRKETRNLGLRKITDELGPQPIRFKWKDNGTIIPPERKAGVLRKIRTQFDLQSHMQSELWLNIKKGIDQHLGKIYTDNKSSLKRDYWVKNPDYETYEMKSSATQEYPSLIQTFFDTHTVDGDEMVRLQGLGTYTDDQITAMVRGGKQRGYILGVGRVLAGRGKDVLYVPVPRCNHTSNVDELKRSNKKLKQQIDIITEAMSSDDRYSQLFTQLQSHHESGSGSGCSASEDDESGDDEDADEDADS